MVLRYVHILIYFFWIIALHSYINIIHIDFIYLHVTVVILFLPYIDKLFQINFTFNILFYLYCLFFFLLPFEKNNFIAIGVVLSLNLFLYQVFSINYKALWIVFRFVRKVLINEVCWFDFPDKNHAWNSMFSTINKHTIAISTEQDVERVEIMHCLQCINDVITGV